MTKFQFVTSYTEENKHRLTDITKQVIDAGCECIQFSWEGDDLDIFSKAEAIRKLTSDNQVKMVVNNRLDVAMAVQADALHIGQRDVPFEIARALLPSTIKIGLTLDNPLQYNIYKHALVDYLKLLLSTKIEIYLA